MTPEYFTPPEQERFENRASFERRIRNFGYTDREDIMYAYDLAKYAHRDQEREDGERYFEHPREVAIIGLDELHTQNPGIIQTLLIHDVFEDTALLGNAKFSTYAENLRIARYRVSKLFGSDVAQDTISVSKPKGVDVEALPKEEQLELYHKHLAYGASPNALVVKGCDRLHNLRTLGVCSIAKQQRKVQETEEIYFPLMRKMGEIYPQYAEYLLKNMKAAIDALHVA